MLQDTFNFLSKDQLTKKKDRILIKDLISNKWKYKTKSKAYFTVGNFAGFQCHAIQNKNQNRSIDKVQNLGNERKKIYKDPRQDSGQRNLSYTRDPKKCFTQTYRDLYGDAMLVLTWMSSNMADGNQQKHLLPSFATKAWSHYSRNS